MLISRSTYPTIQFKKLLCFKILVAKHHSLAHRYREVDIKACETTH